MAPNVAPPHYDVSKENDVTSPVKGDKALKCVLLGDGAVGKTSLIISYTTNGYPTEYQPTAYDNYKVDIHVNSESLRLQIHDTAGQDDFDHLRPLCYSGCDVIMMCFSVVNPTSLVNVKEKWIKEVRKYMPKVPVVLVGTQTDLKSNVDVLIDLAKYNEKPITDEEAWECAKQIGAKTYVQSSSLTLDNLKEAFDTAIDYGLRHQDHATKRKFSWRRDRSPSYTYHQRRAPWWKKFVCMA